MSVYFAPIGCGLGDLIVSLPVINWLVEHQTEPVIIVERGPRQQGVWSLVDGVAGAVREPDLQMSKGDTLINMRDHWLARDYDWGSERFLTKFPGWNIEDIQSAICSDLGLQPDFRKLVPLAHKQCSATHSKVVLVPGTTGDYKCWPAQMWSHLCKRLSQEGIDFVILGEPQHSEVVKQLLDAGLPHHPTPTIEDAVDAVSSALAVIAVDTGLQHIAVQQGVQTVAPVNWLSTYLRRVPHCHPIISPMCKVECMVPHPENPNNPAAFGAENWRFCDYMPCSAPPGEHCMSQIQPDTVFHTLQHCLIATARSSVS